MLVAFSRFRATKKDGDALPRFLTRGALAVRGDCTVPQCQNVGHSETEKGRPDTRTLKPEQESPQMKQIGRERIQ